MQKTKSCDEIECRPLVLSEKLRNILKNIDTDFSRSLLYLEGVSTSKFPKGKTMNYIDIDDDHTFFTFTTNYVSEDVWTKNRNRINIGRFLKKLFEYENDVSIERFVEAIRYSSINTVYIVSGEDIKKYYSRKYTDDGLTSCMVGRSRLLDIYADNPDTCKMAIIKEKNSNKIIARAILWKTTKGIDLIDNIYAKNWIVRNNLLFWAKSQNIERVDKIRGDHKVKVIKKLYKEYPYIDTFKYYDPLRGLLSKSSSFGGSIVCSYTDGYASDNRGVIETNLFTTYRIYKKVLEWVDHIRYNELSFIKNKIK